MRNVHLAKAALVLLFGSVALTPTLGQEATGNVIPTPAKYPLRLHVLATDDTHKTVRMQPNACAGSMPEMSGGAGGGEVGGGCQSNSGTLSFGGDDDFAGAGRGDLMVPPRDTQGFQFTYEGCPRVRVLPGFSSLQARWKKPGKTLEVLIPSDAIDHQDGPLPTQKCTFKVKLHEYVYLRMHSGSLLQVSQDAYWKKPSLRMFLSGGTEVLQQRVQPAELIKP